MKIILPLLFGLSVLLPSFAQASPVRPPAIVGGCGADNNSLLSHPKAFVLGDSITYGLVPDLSWYNIASDGVVCRQWSGGIGSISYFHLPRKVVIELGTNGPFTWRQARRMMAALRFVPHVWLVTVREPRPWQDKVNRTLWQIRRWWKKVRIIDWYTASQNRADWFGPDGIHPNSLGDTQLAWLINRAISTA